MRKVTYGPSITTSGLILAVDAANVKSYSGTGTNWHDLTGSGFEGNLVGGTGFTATDKGSIVLNGSNWSEHPIALGTDATIGVFMKATTYEGRILFSLYSDTYGAVGPDVFIFSGAWYWNIGDSTSNPFSASPSLNTNWHHIVVTNEASSNAKLYVDGVLIGTASYRNCTVTTSGSRFYVGRWSNDTNYNVTGNYASVYVYNRALNASEISQNYQAIKSRFQLS